jgi:D-cysteine desulfhydrase
LRPPFLHERHPGLRDTLPFRRLGTGPTPVRSLERLAPAGTELWLKDEGAYGDGGWGGNKVRKLEWLLPDVRRRGRDTILSVGGLGTNWGLATALYGREQGLRTALALIDQPVDEHVRAQLERLRASGATLHLTHSKARTIASFPWLFARHSRGGRPPYVLPAGGSSPLGVLGYVEAAFEIAEQVRRGELPEPAHVVCPVGSGGTVAGLALGLRLAGLRARVTGIVVNDTLRLDPATLARMAGRAGALLRGRGARLETAPITAADIDAPVDWLGTGYGHPLAAADQTRHRAHDTERIDLDPVYTGKAMAGTLDLLGSGRLGRGPVLFVHTDGPRDTPDLWRT